MCRRRSMVVRLLAAVGCAFPLLSSSLGCGSNKLETGYVYTPLGASASQRRAYYAGPFSPEARAAMMENPDSMGPDNRRPRPGM